MKTYAEMDADVARAELRNLRWKLAASMMSIALDLVIVTTLLYLVIEWYGNLGPCRP